MTNSSRAECVREQEVAGESREASGLVVGADLTGPCRPYRVLTH